MKKGKDLNKLLKQLRMFNVTPYITINDTQLTYSQFEYIRRSFDSMFGLPNTKFK
jgi:hypothetical protein